MRTYRLWAAVLAGLAATGPAAANDKDGPEPDGGWLKRKCKPIWNRLHVYSGPKSKPGPTGHFPVPQPYYAGPGQPIPVSPHAAIEPRFDHHYTGGYVGGGRLVLFPNKQGLDGRHMVNEGTWGHDYTLFSHFPGRVFLDYWHGRKKEPPAGPYNADLPELPDPIAKRPLQKLLTGGREREHDHEEHGGHGEGAKPAGHAEGEKK